jgi:hypothetical protein
MSKMIINGAWLTHKSMAKRGSGTSNWEINNQETNSIDGRTSLFLT